jgi:hypothetical protein
MLRHLNQQVHECAVRPADSDNDSGCPEERYQRFRILRNAPPAHDQPGLVHNAMAVSPTKRPTQQSVHDCSSLMLVPIHTGTMLCRPERTSHTAYRE